VIVVKDWVKRHTHYSVHHYKGWFLFGVLPLFIVRTRIKGD
jgi:hypothetical protein